MEHEDNPYGDPAQPAASPSTPPTRWRVPRVALTVGLAGVLGLAGAGVAFAVTGQSDRPASSGSMMAGGSLMAGTSSTSTPTAPAAPPAGRHGMGRFGPGGGPGVMGGGMVHGVFTVRNGTGYRVEEVQTGVVQPGNTSTSITVRSDDGYSQTYTVQPSTIVNSQAGGISTVKSGDRVRVRAIQQGSSYTATDVIDTTQIGSSRQGFGFDRPGPPAPSAAGTGSAPAA